MFEYDINIAVADSFRYLCGLVVFRLFFALLLCNQ